MNLELSTEISIEEGGAISVEGTPLLALFDGRIIMENPEATKQWLLEKHENIHIVQGVIILINELDSEYAVLASRMLRMAVDCMIELLTIENPNSEEVSEIIECWSNNLHPINTISLN